MTDHSRVIKSIVATVPAALKALAAMERQLVAAKTYDEIRRVIKDAMALKILMSDIAEVKAAAEDAILVGNKRIAEELRKVPKANKHQSSTEGKLTGREATGIPPTSRHRLGKLADIPQSELKAMAQSLREQGKDATVTAVVREITQGDKSERRAQREQVLAQRIEALPEMRYGIILADPEWQFEPYSRDTGMDRAADNHYPTSALNEIRGRDVPSIAADDCVLFLWATVPMMPQAFEVMTAWGFQYVSQFVWVKDRVGTGYWNRNRHELVLIGKRGAPVAPAPGTQFDSVIEAPRGKHSEKPDRLYEIIESYFPNIPKIELNARKFRQGWDRWGLEAPPVEAAE